MIIVNEFTPVLKVCSLFPAMAAIKIQISEGERAQESTIEEGGRGASAFAFEC